MIYINDPKLGRVHFIKYWGLVAFIFCFMGACAVGQACLDITKKVRLWWYDRTIPGLKRLAKLAGIK